MKAAYGKEVTVSQRWPAGQSEAESQKLLKVMLKRGKSSGHCAAECAERAAMAQRKNVTRAITGDAGWRTEGKWRTANSFRAGGEGVREGERMLGSCT